MSQSSSTEQMLETISRERSVIDELVALSARVALLADDLVTIQNAKIGLARRGPAAIGWAIRLRQMRRIA